MEETLAGRFVCLVPAAFCSVTGKRKRKWRSSEMFVLSFGHGSLSFLDLNWTFYCYI